MDFFYSAEKSFNDDGTLNVTVSIDHISESRWLIPILLSFGDGAVVVEPTELRETVKAKLEKMIKRYSEV